MWLMRGGDVPQMEAGGGVRQRPGTGLFTKGGQRDHTKAAAPSNSPSSGKFGTPTLH